MTDRGEVVAELRPAHRQRRRGEELEEILDLLTEEGEITRASLPKRAWTWKASGLGLAPGTAQDLLDAIRSDRAP